MLCVSSRKIIVLHQLPHRHPHGRSLEELALRARCGPGRRRGCARPEAPLALDELVGLCLGRLPLRLLALEELVLQLEDLVVEVVPLA